MPKLNKRVARGLKNLPSSFHAGEFAYLCLTSKSEAHLRDHLAFALQRQLSELKGFRKFLVSREWHRHDIAILTRGAKAPKAIVEVKVFYTFDCLEKNIFKRMKKQLRKDVEKVKAGGPGNAERMVLLFLTHPRASIPKELHEVFAYGAEVSRFYREYGGPAEVLKKARQELGKFWRNVSARRVTTGVYAPGAYQGIEVRVPYWLAEV